MTLVVEKNIPIPPKGSKWNACEKMKIGDSILLESNAQASALRQNFREWSFRERKVENGVRVWRIK